MDWERQQKVLAIRKRYRTEVALAIKHVEESLKELDGEQCNDLNL